MLNHDVVPAGAALFSGLRLSHTHPNMEGGEGQLKSNQSCLCPHVFSQRGNSVQSTGNTKQALEQVSGNFRMGQLTNPYTSGAGVSKHFL